jgi:hypothetical protein
MEKEALSDCGPRSKLTIIVPDDDSEGPFYIRPVDCKYIGVIDSTPVQHVRNLIASSKIAMLVLYDNILITYLLDYSQGMFT